MVYNLIRWLLCASIEAMCLVTTTRILTMRHKGLFYAIRTANLVTDALFRTLRLSHPLIALFQILVMDFGMPIALSTDSLRVRLSRSTFIEFGGFSPSNRKVGSVERSKECVAGTRRSLRAVKS